MALVLGIDAAWTEAGSSGVALLRVEGDEGCVLACAPSYQSFVSREEWRATRRGNACGSAACAPALLAAAAAIGGAPVDVIAIDMPVARNPVAGRRYADRAVSRIFGNAWATTHSPTAARPGEHGRRFAENLRAAGFSLVTACGATAGPALIEVYPLAALVRLLGLARRPPYKVARSARYWPGLPPADRIDRLIEQWASIAAILGQRIKGLPFSLPARSRIKTLAALKPFEDMLDAVICAYVGALFLRGAAEAIGDENAAIWVPKAGVGP